MPRRPLRQLGIAFTLLAALPWAAAAQTDAPASRVRPRNSLRSTPASAPPSQSPATSSAQPTSTQPAPVQQASFETPADEVLDTDAPPAPPALTVPSIAPIPANQVHQVSAPEPTVSEETFEGVLDPDTAFQDDYWQAGEPLGRPRHLYVQLDYLNWQTKGMYAPPLVSTGANAADLALPNATILFGNQDYINSPRDGGRIRIGSDWGCLGCGGWEVEFFGLNQEQLSYSASSDATGLPFLGRPFFNINPLDDLGNPDPPARQDAELVSEQRPDGFLVGTVAVNMRTSFSGAAARWRCNIASDNGLLAVEECGDMRYASIVNFVAGYRYLRLREGILITEDLTNTDNGPPVVTTDFDIFDRFDTMNEFNGVELGVEWLTHHRDWTMALTGRMSLGDIQQSVRINGETQINGAAGVGGLLAQSSNIGLHQRNVFGVVPELEMRISKQVTQHIRFSAGYTFIYWSRVARPGEHIDLDVNPELLPPAVASPTGALRPAFAWNDTDYWAHGLTLGVDFIW